MQEGNKSLRVLKNVQFGRGIFTLSFVAYITVDFKKFVSDLFYPGSSLVGSESIKRKTIFNILDPNGYFSDYNLKNAGRKQKFACA